MSSFEGRRALVTGGAGGIGSASARLLAAGGASVALLDVTGSVIRDVAAELGTSFVTADVRDEVEVAAAVREAVRVLGAPVDLLVNAAGVYRIASMTELSVDEWDEVLAINLRGSWLVAREVVRVLAEVGVSGGSVVNISSTAGLVADGIEPAAHYNASKAGIIALTKQMAVEWAPLGIRANAVCPGLIDTPMLRIMDDPEVGSRYVRDAIPLQRIGRPEEVAALIGFLASDEASYITGVAVPIDGGVTAI